MNIAKTLFLVLIILRAITCMAQTPEVTVTPSATTVQVGQPIEFTIACHCDGGLAQIGFELCSSPGIPVANMTCITIDYINAAHVFTWVPYAEGTYLFEGYAWSAGYLQLTRTSTIVVTVGSSVPQATIAPSTTTAYVGQTIAFNITGRCDTGLAEIGLELCDAAGTAVTNLGWAQVGGSDASYMINWAAPAAGTYYFYSYTWSAGFSQFTRTAVMAITVGQKGWSTPNYEPWYWNDWYPIQYLNNCYNYSNNKRTDNYAQPGYASGRMYSAIRAEEMSAAAISDGLEPTTATATSPSGKTKMALAVWPGMDYHWYRQDSDGLWSHKPGSSVATNLDSSGNKITDPEAANRGWYIEFVGYFFTPSDAVQGQGHADIAGPKF